MLACPSQVEISKQTTSHYIRTYMPSHSSKELYRREGDSRLTDRTKKKKKKKVEKMFLRLVQCLRICLGSYYLYWQEQLVTPVCNGWLNMLQLEELTCNNIHSMKNSDHTVLD